MGRDGEVDLIDSERGLGTDGVPSNLEVFLNFTNFIFLAVNGLLHNRCGIKVKHTDESLLRGWGGSEDGVFPVLPRNLSTNPFSSWTRLVRVAEGIHDNTGLSTSALLMSDVRVFINDEKEIHQIATDTTAV